MFLFLGGPTSRTSLSSGSIVTASRGDADGRNEDSSSMGSEGNDSFGSGKESSYHCAQCRGVFIFSKFCDIF